MARRHFRSDFLHHRFFSGEALRQYVAAGRLRRFATLWLVPMAARGQG